MDKRVRQISPQPGRSGTMTSLNPLTGRADVTFDDGTSATVEACHLQYLEDDEQQP